MKWLMFFPFVVLSFFATPSALNQVTVDGFGTGIAREDALIAAKRSAVVNAIKSLLSSQIEIDSFTAKEDECISKTENLLKEWEILSEEKISDSLYEIKLKANLSKPSILKELGSSNILIKSMNKPKVLVLITEENCGIWEPQNKSAENAIHNFLKDPFQFDLINPSISASIKSSKSKINQINNDLSVAVLTGTQNGAEVLIIGSALSRKSENYSFHNKNGMISVDADVTLKAINCTTGSLISSSSSQATATEMSHITAGNIAIEKAATEAVQKLLDPIIQDWQGQLSIGFSVNLKINGVKAFRQKTVIIQTLNRMANISSVHEQFWDMQTATLEILLYYKGNPNDFYKKIDGYKLISGGGSLAVTGMSGQNVTLIAQPM